MDNLEEEMDKTLPHENNENEEKSKNLLVKSKDLNHNILEISQETEKLITDLNDPYTNLNHTTNLIKNSYYDAFEYMVIETV